MQSAQTQAGAQPSDGKPEDLPGWVKSKERADEIYAGHKTAQYVKQKLQEVGLNSFDEALEVIQAGHKAQQAMQNYEYLLNVNPAAYLEILEKSHPVAAQNLRLILTKGSRPNNSSPQDQQPEPDLLGNPPEQKSPEVARLEAKVAQLEAKFGTVEHQIAAREQLDRARAQDNYERSVVQSFGGEVDTFLDDLNIPRERAGIRQAIHSLAEDLAVEDRAVQSQIQRKNFSAVPALVRRAHDMIMKDVHLATGSPPHEDTHRFFAHHSIGCFSPCRIQGLDTRKRHGRNQPSLG